MTEIEPQNNEQETPYQIPPYKPVRILSPEFSGTSNYEVGITDLLKEKMEKLDRLRRDPKASATDVSQAEEDLKTLDCLYENFNIGMNVFRTAKGGRDKIKE
jgi:colicin import membrane protein